MNCRILLLLALVAFTTCSSDFLVDHMNSLKKEVRKGHRHFSKCLKEKMTQPDKDIKDLIKALKDEDYDTIGKLTLKLYKEGKSIKDCLKPRNDEEDNGINWPRVLKCVEGLIGMIPCGRAVATAIIAKSIPAAIQAIVVCPSGIRGAVKGCLP